MITTSPIQIGISSSSQVSLNFCNLFGALLSYQTINWLKQKLKVASLSVKSQIVVVGSVSFNLSTFTTHKSHAVMAVIPPPLSLSITKKVGLEVIEIFCIK